MSDSTVTITFNVLPALLAALPDAMQDRLTQAGTLLYDRSQIEVPVRQGWLQASGTLTLAPGVATVRYATVYVFFVHFGTSRQSPNPFLQRAFDAVQAGAAQILGQAVSVAARQAGAR